MTKQNCFGSDKTSQICGHFVIKGFCTKIRFSLARKLYSESVNGKPRGIYVNTITM